MARRKSANWTQAELDVFAAKSGKLLKDLGDADPVQSARQKAAKTKRKNTGKWLEKDLSDYNSIYEEKGIARIRKVDPPTRMVKIKGKWMPIQLENPFLDFVGVWKARAGRTIFVEAKSTLDDRLALENASGLKVHQRESLQAWRAANAAVCVLWGYKGQLRYLSLALIEARFANGHKSVLWAHAEPIPEGMGFLRFDWMSNLAKEFPI